jgi:hypothetical protein
LVWFFHIYCYEKINIIFIITVFNSF